MDPVDEAQATLNRTTDIDYLMVADFADVVGGKLYLMGGSWDKLQPPAFPHQLLVGIAVGIRVPFPETGDSHKISIRLEGADGHPMVQIEADLQTGRPPGMLGQDMLVPMAFNVPVKFEEPGGYLLSASANERPPKRYQITAVTRPG